MAIWGTPKGGLGYEKRGFRASEQGCRGGVLGCLGLRNGGAEASLYAQNWVKGEKVQSIFAIFMACKTASFVDIKHGKITPKPRF